MSCPGREGLLLVLPPPAGWDLAQRPPPAPPLAPRTFRLSREKSQPPPYLKHWCLDLSQQRKHALTDRYAVRAANTAGLLLALEQAARCSLAEHQVKKLACISGPAKLSRSSEQLRLHNEGRASKPENRNTGRGGGRGPWTQPAQHLISAPLGDSVRATNKSISGDVLCGPPLMKLPSFLHKAKGRGEGVSDRGDAEREGGLPSSGTFLKYQPRKFTSFFEPLSSLMQRR